MVGYLYPLPEDGPGRRLWLRPLRAETVRVHGLTLLGVALPPGGLPRRLDRGAGKLRKRGCARVLTAPGLDCPGWGDILRRNGLSPVDPLPLCRAKGGELALALVEQLPLRRRCVALRGENAGEAWAAAAALCPQVGTLLLDFRRGEEAMLRRLRETFGAAALRLGQGPPPQVSVEFAPCGGAVGKPLRLWGEPELGGLVLTGEGGEPVELPLLTLLWETGRLGLGNIGVRWGEYP